MPALHNRPSFTMARTKAKMQKKHGIARPMKIKSEAGKVEGGDAVARKKIRWKSGTVALREIRRYQKSASRLLPKQSIYRLIAEVLQEQSRELGVNVTQMSPQAREAIWTEAEDHLATVFKDAQNLAVLRGGVTITKADMDHVRRENEKKINVLRSMA